MFGLLKHQYSFLPTRHTLSLFIIHMTHERSHLVLNIVIFLAQFGINSVYQRTQMFIALERVFFKFEKLQIYCESLNIFRSNKGLFIILGI